MGSMDKGYGIPEIFEEEAYGPLGALYKDIKLVLKVPIVNFIFRTLAHYEAFLMIGWNEVRPNLLTMEMEEAAAELRYPRIIRDAPDYDWSRVYNPSELTRLRQTVSVFNYVNTKLLLIATAWKESLSNRPVIGTGHTKGSISPGVYPTLPSQIPLIHLPSAPLHVQELLLDISSTHRTYDVASDYRALAYFPDFLNASWRSLKPYIETDEYKLTTAKLLDQAVKLVQQMPFPVTVHRGTLAPYYSDAGIAGIMGVVSMFQSFLPALIVDGAFFHHMLLQK